MPLPSPKNGEKRSDFVNRCMVDLSKKGEFKDDKQRAAVCYDAFKKAESKASIEIADMWRENDKILYFSSASPDVSKHYFKTEEEAAKDAKKMGLKGIHTHKTEDGKTLYMAGPNHEAFMKKHKEVAGNTKKQWDKIDKKELKKDTKKQKEKHEKDAVEDDKSKIKKLKKGNPSEKKKAEKRALKKDIKYDKKSEKAYAAERYGGKKRSDLKDSDFLDPKRRSFPCDVLPRRKGCR